MLAARCSVPSLPLPSLPTFLFHCFSAGLDLGRGPWEGAPGPLSPPAVRKPLVQRHCPNRRGGGESAARCPVCPVEAAPHLFLPYHEQHVLPGPHGHRLAEDADLQAPRRQEGALQLRRALLRVHAALAHVGHHLPVPAARHRVRQAGVGRALLPRRTCLPRGGSCLGELHSSTPSLFPTPPVCYFCPILEMGKLRLRGGNDQ